MKTVYITDCEGPITKNDNAYELSSHFIPSGGHLFSLLSRYDDVLAYTYRRKGYRAGNTLKLIVPFLKAYGATNQEVEVFSRKNMVLVPKADSFLRWVNRTVPTFVISTSYEPYINALSDLLRFPRRQTFSTRLDLDGHQLSEQEVDCVKRKALEILQYPMIPEVEGKCDEAVSRTTQSLDQIFEELSAGESGKLMNEVEPVGGEEKAKVVLSIVERMNCEFEKVIYVGDSITDAEALRLVRERSGLAISFNGNRYAVQDAKIAVISKTAEVLECIVSAFLKGSKKEAVKLACEWDSMEYPKLFVTTPESLDAISKESSEMRRHLRGKRIGALG